MKKLIALLALVALLVPYSAFALTTMDGESIVLDQPVEDDLYVAAGSVRVRTTINGDLHAVGGNISIDGEINGDLVAAGGSLSVRSKVADDVRVAGGDVIISSEIGGDLIVFGGEVIIQPEAVIAGDIIVGGGLVEIWGQVNGDVRAYSGNLGIYGTINGNLKADIDDDLKIGDAGLVKGNVIYSSREEFELNAANVEGTITPELWKHNRDKDSAKVTAKGLFAGIKIGYAVFMLVSSLLLGLILVLVTPKLVYKSAEVMKKEALMSIVIGIAVFASLIFLMIAGAISIVGFKVALLAMTKFISALLLMKIMAGYFVGHMIFRPKKTVSKVEMFGVMAVGLVIVYAVGLVPVIGPLLVTVVSLLALGGACMYGWSLFKELRKKNLV